MRNEKKQEKKRRTRERGKRRWKITIIIKYVKRQKVS